MIATSTDCLYVNLETEFELDMDDEYQISSIKNCQCDQDYFYIFTNKKDRKLGYYFLRVGVENP